MAYQLLNTASMAKYNPNQYTRQSSGAVVLNQGVKPIAGTVKDLGQQATVAKGPTDRMAVTVGTPQAQKAFGQGYQLEQKISGPSQLPQFTQTNKVGSNIYGIKIPEKLPTSTLGNETPFKDNLQANLQSKGNESADINNFSSTLNNVYQGLQASRKNISDLMQPSQQVQDLGTQLADLQTGIKKYDIGTQEGLYGLEGQGRGITAGIVRGQQEKLSQQRALGRQSMAADETNLINRLGLAQDAQKTAIDAAKFGYSSLLDDANLAFKVQERVDQQNQLALQQAQTLQGAALQKATLAMNAFKEGLVGGKNPEALKSSIGLLLNQAGIDPTISSAMFDAVQNGVEYDRLQKLATAGQVSATTRANMINSLVQTGLSVEEATNKVSQILGASGELGGVGNVSDGIGGTVYGSSAGVPDQSGLNRPQRNNNPANIKVPAAGIEEARKRYNDPGATIDPSPATDGGYFIKFSSPEKGTAAIGELLKSGYSGLTVDAAMRRWSGGGYGGEISPSIANKTISSLSSAEMSNLQEAMKRREGFYAGKTTEGTITPPNVSGKYSQDVIDSAERIKTGQLSIDDPSIKNISNNVRKYMSESNMSIPLTEQQIKTIDSSDEGKKIKTNIDLKQKIEKYKTLFDEYGTELWGTGAALLESAFADLKISWKEAASLGALTGPDVAIIGQAIKSATGLEGKKNALLYGEEGIKQSIDSALNTLTKSSSAIMDRLLSKNKSYANSDYIKQLKSQAGVLDTSQPVSIGSTGTTSSGVTFTIKK